jgi:hypothetical protein
MTSLLYNFYFDGSKYKLNQYNSFQFCLNYSIGNVADRQKGCLEVLYGGTIFNHLLKLQNFLKSHQKFLTNVTTFFKNYREFFINLYKLLSEKNLQKWEGVTLPFTRSTPDP